jgi:transcriptional regulator with XRE-family HTH domain
MQDLDSFANWLRKRRKALDLSRAELSKRASCSAITQRRLEAADLRPSRDLAGTLAAALGIPPEGRQAFVEFARGIPGPGRLMAHRRSARFSFTWAMAWPRPGCSAPPQGCALWDRSQTAGDRHLFEADPAGGRLRG